MKRILLLLLFCTLLLSGCGTDSENTPVLPPDPADSAPLPTETVSIDYLALEFARDLYDPTALLTLARETAPLLQKELATRGYDVREIGCTIGAGNLMTAQALNEGGVDIAVLPAESYAELCYDDARPVLGGTAKESFTCGIFAASSDYGTKLSKKNPLSLEDLEKAHWGITAQDDACRAYASLYLADHYEGTTLDMLPHISEFESAEALAAAAQQGEVDIAVLESSDALTLLFETEPIYSSVVAVTMQNETAASDSFVRALRESFMTILAQNPDLLSLYNIRHFTPVQNADLDPARRILTITS